MTMPVTSTRSSIGRVQRPPEGCCSMDSLAIAICVCSVTHDRVSILVRAITSVRAIRGSAFYSPGGMPMRDGGGSRSPRRRRERPNARWHGHSQWRQGDRRGCETTTFTHTDQELVRVQTEN